MTVLLPALQPKTLSLNSAIQRRLATYTHTARISWPSLGRCPGLVLDLKSTHLPESSRIQPVTLANPVGLLGLVLKPVFATLAHSACPTPLVVLVPKFPHFRAAPRGSHVPVRLKPLPMKPCTSRRATLQVTLSRCCHMSLITTFSRTCGPLVYKYFQQPHSFQRIAKDSRCAHVSLPGCCKCNSPRPHSRPCASNCPRGMAPRRPAVHPCHLCRTLTWLSRKMAIEPRWKLSARIPVSRQSSNHCCKSWGFRFLVQCSPCHGKTSRCLDLHFSLKYFRARAASHQPSGLQAWMPLALTSKRFLGLMFRPSCWTSPPLKGKACCTCGSKIPDSRVFGLRPRAEHAQPLATFLVLRLMALPACLTRLGFPLPTEEALNSQVVLSPKVLFDRGRPAKSSSMLGCNSLKHQGPSHGEAPLAKVPRLVPDLSRQVPLLVELCAGSAIFSSVALASGWDVTPIDQSSCRFSPRTPLVFLDLRDPLCIDLILRFDQGAPADWFHLGLPCGTCSRARERALPGNQGARPLRGPDDLFGFAKAF